MTAKVTTVNKEASSITAPAGAQEAKMADLSTGLAQAIRAAFDAAASVADHYDFVCAAMIRKLASRVEVFSTGIFSATYRWKLDESELIPSFKPKSFNEGIEAAAKAVESQKYLSDFRLGDENGPEQMAEKLRKLKETP